MRHFVAAIGIAAVVSAPAFGQCTDAERARLEEFDRAWGKATTAGDRPALMTIYADDYMGVSFAGTQDKTSAVNDAVAAAERQRASSRPAPAAVYDNYIISCTPTSATLTHRNTITTSANGKESTTYSRSVHVLEKRAGRWQVVSNAGHALNDAATLTYIENDWNQAIKTKDVAWYDRNYADDYTGVTSGTGALENKAEALASAKNDKSVVESLVLSDLTVRIDGNVAIVTGINHRKGRDANGMAEDVRIRFTDTFIRRDGRWLAWASQGTRIR